MKKVIKWVLIGIAGLILVIGAGAYFMFADCIKAAGSVKKLNENLYCMEFKGDYGFDDYLEQGGAPSDSIMAEYIISFLSHGFYKPDTAEIESTDYGCSALKAQNESGAYIYGRNYDWDPCKTMVIHTIPDNGYESVMTSCLDFLGFGDEWLPEGFANQYMAIAAIYVPMDGMNEKGVVIADLMAGDKIETHQNTDKPDLTTTAAIRMVLDHAATVDEAITLLSQYDMNSAIGTAHHYYLADQNGKSVVVEYVDDEMVVTETNILTNHYLAKDKYGIGSENSHGRFEQLSSYYDMSSGRMSMEELTAQMKGVSVGQFPDASDLTQKTIWTCCYDTEKLTVDFYFLENYNQKYSIKLNNGSNWIE